jgi:signal transduction histidine kinase
MGLGLAIRIALASLAVAGLGMAILVVGVLVVGRDAFQDLMLEAGDTAASAEAMYGESVGRVVIGSAIVAIVVAVIVAVVLGRRLARPIAAVSRAVDVVANGDYAARVRAEGPEELASLASSFNAMAMALEDQERMRREFIANAAHELRTPLTNLQGYLEALRDGILTADRATYESLLDEADRLVRLSRGLETLAESDTRVEPRAVTRIDLAEHIRSALALAVPAFDRASLTLEADVPEHLDALADPDRLKQVLDNLLSNAIRYTPAGGHVTVTAAAARDTVRVTIANTGDGIPAGDLPHVFERFYRVEKSRDRARGGAGIGLAIVHEIVGAMGGRVGVDSKDGLTTFWFTLPIAASPAAA